MFPKRLGSGSKVAFGNVFSCQPNSAHKAAPYLLTLLANQSVSLTWLAQSWESFDVYEHVDLKLKQRLEKQFRKLEIHYFIVFKSEQSCLDLFNDEELASIAEIADKSLMLLSLKIIAYFCMDS